MSYLETQLINTMVEKLLRGSDKAKDHILSFHLENETRSYRLEFYAPSNYVSVHLRQEIRTDKGYEFTEPTLYSCHDSCWRDDGTRRVFSDIKPIHLGLYEWKFEKIDPDQYMIYRQRGRNEYKVEVYTDEIREKEQREEREREDAYYEEYGEEE
jgi:hypothetical protein